MEEIVLQDLLSDRAERLINRPEPVSNKNTKFASREVENLLRSLGRALSAFTKTTH